VPSALTGPHSYFGQQVAGSVAICLAHGQRIAGHVVAVPAGVDALHVGHVTVWQHVIGSKPDGIGVAPSGQTGTNVGHRCGLFGSHVGFAGTHCPSHD
jgi:hypothetical protein